MKSHHIHHYYYYCLLCCNVKLTNDESAELLDTIDQSIECNRPRALAFFC